MVGIFEENDREAGGGGAGLGGSGLQSNVNIGSGVKWVEAPCMKVSGLVGGAGHPMAVDEVG